MRINTPKFLLAVALLLSAMQSCNTADDQLVAKNQETIQNQIPEVDYRVDMQFVGARGGALSKAYLASNKSDVLFSDGEKISVFDGQYNNEFVAANGGAEAEFAGKALSASTYYMLNPYQENARLENGNIVATVPLQQKAVEGTFDPKACVAVAKCANGQSFELLNVGAIARLETTEPFAKIVLKTLGKQNISGKVSVNPETAVASIIEGASNEVSLIPAEGSSEISKGVYFLSVLPAVLNEGAVLEFHTADGGVKTKTFATPITITKSKGINFGKIQSYDEADEEEMTLAKAKTPQDVFKAMGLGWNLGNQFDGMADGMNEWWWADETNWGNPKTTQQLFDKLKEAGVKTVRIPVTWFCRATLESFNDGIPNYVIRQEWLDRVHEVVGYAKKAGLNAIINIHHDGSADSKETYEGSKEYNFSNKWLYIGDAAKDDSKNEIIKTQIAKFWAQIANEFKDEGDYLIFEGLNEIHDGRWGWNDYYWGNTVDGGKQYGILNEWNQLFVNTVRATGGNNATRWLSVPGYAANPEFTVNYTNVPNDAANRIMIAIHYYGDDYDFALGNSNYAWSSKRENEVEPLMRKVYDKFVANNVPVYVGEIGCTNFDDEGKEKNRRYFLEYTCRVLHNYYMSPILWDNGKAAAGAECHGYFDHETGAWMNDYSERTVNCMKLAVESEEAGYDLDYIRTYKKPSSDQYTGN
ncbi:MAG: glycoside hydrolase family 5 protein [Bacteroidales bacterium]|nr:glycoside hydrolase family 5 protein [Bacteroidales bacterium]